MSKYRRIRKPTIIYKKEHLITILRLIAYKVCVDIRELNIVIERNDQNKYNQYCKKGLSYNKIIKLSFMLLTNRITNKDLPIKNSNNPKMTNIIYMLKTHLLFSITGMKKSYNKFLDLFILSNKNKTFISKYYKEGKTIKGEIYNFFTNKDYATLRNIKRNGFESKIKNIKLRDKATNRYWSAYKRAQEYGYLKADITREELNAIRSLYEDAILLEKETNQDYHVDHIIPVSPTWNDSLDKKLNGFHELKNLQIVTPEYNIKKHDTIDPIKYPEQRALLG